MRLTDADVLLEKFADLEATALDMCRRHMHDDDLTMWRRWSVILAERTAYKYDVFDAPTVDAVPVIRCKDCKWYERAEPGMVYCPNIVGGWVEEEGYCYLAERREE